MKLGQSLLDKLIPQSIKLIDCLNQFEGKLAKKIYIYTGRLLTLLASHSTAAGTQSKDLTVTVHFPGI